MSEYNKTKRSKSIAKELGRRGGKIGGHARAAALTPKRRSEIARQREAWEAARTETLTAPQQMDDKGIFWLPTYKYGSMDDWKKEQPK